MQIEQKSVLTAVLFFIFCISLKAENDIDILLYEKIPMKDGINLSAKIWKPSGVNNYLAIFWFTPYVSDEQHTDARQFTEAGYAFVSVDVRGRGDSEGEFFPLENDGEDGSQVIKWIAKQPWCNGSVVMMGGSYRGMVQWQTLMHKPGAALKAISPSASVGPGIDYPQPKNIFYSYTARWLGFVSGKTRCSNLFSDTDYWKNKYYKMYSDYIAFEKLDSLTGIPSKIFDRWISHPEYDDYWKAMTPSPEHYRQIDIPVLSITGHFDDDQHGAMNYYFNHQKYGKKEALDNHYLVIGPWDHSGTRRPKKELFGLVFPENAVMDMNDLQIKWFDFILNGGKMPEFLKKRLSIYQMGMNKWLYADSFDELSNETKTYFLTSENGSANDVFAAGMLSEMNFSDKPDVINYNPLDLMPKDDYMKLVKDEKPYLSQRLAFQENALVYHTEPLKEEMHIAGYLNLKLYLEMNVPDADIAAYFYEIKPDGTSIYLTYSFIRARYRNSLEKPELVKFGEINLYEMKAYNFFARTLEKGSRLRLVVFPLNTPEMQKNYCGGGIVSQETKNDTRGAVIKLYHNEKYQSTLEIPILNAELIINN